MFNWDKFDSKMFSQFAERDTYEYIVSDEKIQKHNAFLLDPDTVLGIPAYNALRRDSKQVIYYGVALFDVWTFRLIPEQVVCLSLFDGKRTIAEIANILAFLSDCDQYVADLKIRFFLYKLDFSQKPTFVDVKKNPEVLIRQIDFSEYFIKETVRSFRLDAPTSLILMPTDKCLTDCEYCYACRKPVHNKDILGTERILELIDEAHQLGIIAINVDGGDIFARDEHMVILERILKYGIDPNISTKGYISKDKAKELKKIGLKWLQVGLDSTQEMCDKLVQRKGYFARTIETIYNLNETGIAVRTNSIITRESLHLLPDLIDFLMTLPLFDIKVASAFLGLHRGNETMLLTSLQKKWMRKIMEQKVEQYPDHKINWECEEDWLDASEAEKEAWFNGRPYCSSGRTQIVIAPDGKVTTCEQSPQDGIFICGDCRVESIQEVWNSSALKEWYEPSREKFLETPCYNCESFNHCIHGMGHCWLQVYKTFGTLYAPHPYCPQGKMPKQRWR